MLTSKIISKKNIIVNSVGTLLNDLIYSTFRFPNSNASGGIVIVNEYENMRPDLLADRIYGDQGKWDAMLKYNGISNPFSLHFGQILSTLQFQTIDGVYVSPRPIAERGERKETDVNGILSGPNNKKPDKDKNRIDNLANKNKQRAKGAAAAKNAKAGAITSGPNGALPPNINKPGDKNVKVKDGRLVFGEDVTTINKDNCPVPISRARLQAALLKDKLFL